MVQVHEAHLALAELVTVEEVNKVARSLLSFVSHFGREGEALEAAAVEPDQWVAWGPSRATCLVGCIPAFTDESGHSTGEGCRPGAALLPDARRSLLSACCNASA